MPEDTIPCNRCGCPNEDNNYKCVACGAVIHEASVVPPSRDIANHLALAILAAIFCCLPFGIVAIVYAAQVNAQQARGDIAGAQRASGEAWRWIRVSLVAAILPYLIVAIYVAMLISVRH
ncbi:MAG: CD225/dispanin family protein [Candidatus Brocadiia bacterium]